MFGLMMGFLELSQTVTTNLDYALTALHILVLTREHT
jgi:hypothetical protein